MHKSTSAIVHQFLSRRALLGGMSVAALSALTACSGGTATSPATVTGSAAPATATPAASTSVTASGSVAGLAQTFQTTLGTDLQSQLLQDYSLANAKLWSNLPQALLAGGMGGGPGGGGSTGVRIGLSLADLDATQLAAPQAFTRNLRPPSRLHHRLEATHAPSILAMTWLWIGSSRTSSW
jgi:hypothetical protein